MRRVLGLVIALLASGCSVASLDDEAGGTKHNECSSDSDCGDGGKCDASMNVCIAPTGQFGTVLFEVTPPANQGLYGEVGFIVTKDVSPSGGELSLDLGTVAKVLGTVQPAASPYATSCEAQYGQFKVTFTPSARILGLPAEKYTVKTAANDKDQQVLEATIPPDDYDIYVEPDLASPGFLDTSCPVAPQVFRAIKIESSNGVDLTLPLSPPSLLKIEVLWSATNGKALAGWSVDVIDPKSGRVLSAPAKLEPYTTVAPDGFQHFVASVHYAPLTDGASGTELVRVKPVEGVVAPTLVMERAAVEAMSPGEAKIDQLEQLPVPVVLDSLQLVDSEGVRQESLGSATVRFVSTKLDVTSPTGSPILKQGTLAFFERTEEAIDGQVVNVELLPGEYDVYVAPPPGSGFATTAAKLVVGSTGTSQGGKTVMLQPVSESGGQVMIPSGQAPAEGATVLPVASPMQPDALQMAVGSKPFQPLATSGIVGKDGQFTLQADPGTFDFSIRPKDGTGFAWLVRPNVQVQPGIHDLGQMSLPLPVVYQGAVTVPGSLMPDARIRAYLFLDEAGYTADREGATSVVQIAETRADSAGSFTLYLPSHLN